MINFNIPQRLLPCLLAFALMLWTVNIFSQCPTIFTPDDVSGEYCNGSDLNLVAPNDPNVSYAWSASSTAVTVTAASAASTTASLNTAELCAAESVDISLVAICTIDNSVVFDGVVSTVNIYPNPPSDPADLVNYLTLVAGCDEPAMVIAGCENTITLVPDAANPTFPVMPGNMGTAAYTVSFAHAAGPNCCLDVSGSVTDIVVDGSFEAGPFAGTWVEASSNFGTPICDLGGCGTGTGTGPSDGDFWAWFGGISASEIGSVCQSITVPAGIVSLDLNFDLETILCDSPNDFMQVTIDGANQVFFVDGSSLTCGVLGYSTNTIDLLAAGVLPGSTFTLCFESEIFATNGNLTNFFVDNVQLLAAEPSGVDPCVGSITVPYNCTCGSCDADGGRF